MASYSKHMIEQHNAMCCTADTHLPTSMYVYTTKMNTQRKRRNNSNVDHYNNSIHTSKQQAHATTTTTAPHETNAAFPTPPHPTHHSPHPLLVDIPFPLHSRLLLLHLLQILFLKLHQPGAQQHVIPPRACQPTIPLCAAWLHHTGVPMHHHATVAHGGGEQRLYAGTLTETIPSGGGSGGG